MAVTSPVEPVAMRLMLRSCLSFAPLLLLVFLVSDQNISARTRMPVDLPPLVLWAWDRDDDLSFIDMRDTAVAYLAATVILGGGRVLLWAAQHPLAPPAGTPLIAGAHGVGGTSEPPTVGRRPSIPGGRGIYECRPRRWNAETYAALRERIRQWSDASRL